MIFNSHRLRRRFTVRQMDAAEVEENNQQRGGMLQDSTVLEKPTVNRG